MPKPITIIEHSGDDSGVKIDNIGFQGHACDAATKLIEETLGGQVTNRENKKEYHRTAAVKSTTANKQKA